MITEETGSIRTGVGRLEKELEGTQTILRKESRSLEQTMVKDLTKTVRVNGGEVEGLHPGDDVRRDGVLTHIVLCQVALIQSHYLRITFHFSGMEEMIVSTQQDGDLAGVV